MHRRSSDRRHTTEATGTSAGVDAGHTHAMTLPVYGAAVKSPQPEISTHKEEYPRSAVGAVAWVFR